LKIIIVFLLLINFVYSKTINKHKWPNGESLITFLSKHNISKNIYFDLSKTDKELCSEIVAGIDYEIATKNGVIQNILIPISEDMQIHIFQENNKFTLDIIPIVYDTYEKILVVSIKNSPYEDIILTSNNYKLAHEFVRNFKKSFNFRTLQVNDKIIIKYIQKVRLGKYYGTPVIIAATVQGKYKKNYIYRNPSDGRYYNEKGKSLTSVFFKVPLKYRRISSKFTKKRWHPILKKYRAHHGIDYAAPTGRKIRATAPGKVIFKGRKGGYGKTIIIRHKGGYKSLYAHQSKFVSSIRKNSWVKQGQVIGYVGSTGRSTGPHLHFGLYKNGKAINPAKVMRYSKKTLTGKVRTQYLKFIKSTKKELLDAVVNNDKIFKIDTSEDYYNLDANISSQQSKK
jgi:murein DD-endopeptidase MepM/ murein hydrolase activator NlpD